MIKLFQIEVLDKFMRENFRKLESFLNQTIFEKAQFSFRETRLAKADAVVAVYPYTAVFPHQLLFQPKDIIQMSITPDDATVTWNYDDFTKTHLSATISKEVTVRFLVGRYEEN
jgi:hypothetical protein